MSTDIPERICDRCHKEIAGVQVKGKWLGPLCLQERRHRQQRSRVESTVHVRPKDWPTEYDSLVDLVINATSVEELKAPILVLLRHKYERN